MLSDRLTFSRFAMITAEAYDVSIEEAESMISRARAEAALTASSPAAGEFVLHPEPVEQAARCCIAVIRLRPLPHDNKRVAYRCMQEMLARYQWGAFNAKPRKIAAMLDGLGNGSIEDWEFVLWVYAQVGRTAWLRYWRRRRLRLRRHLRLA
jgi:hypothetical protein